MGSNWNPGNWVVVLKKITVKESFLRDEVEKRPLIIITMSFAQTIRSQLISYIQGVPLRWKKRLPPVVERSSRRSHSLAKWDVGTHQVNAHMIRSFDARKSIANTHRRLHTGRQICG